MGINRAIRPGRVACSDCRRRRTGRRTRGTGKRICAGRSNARRRSPRGSSGCSRNCIRAGRSNTRVCTSRGTTGRCTWLSAGSSKSVGSSQSAGTVFCANFSRRGNRDSKTLGQECLNHQAGDGLIGVLGDFTLQCSRILGQPKERLRCVRGFKSQSNGSRLRGFQGVGHCRHSSEQKRLCVKKRDGVLVQGVIGKFENLRLANLVKRSFRLQGFANRLLRHLLRRADKQQHVIRLSIGTNPHRFDFLWFDAHARHQSRDRLELIKQNLVQWMSWIADDRQTHAYRLLE